MKIGAVCEQTGLTDRTVRFYTEEGLLSPSYTKNYLGRKTFDFSEADVAMLKHIAVLRKYGFGIPEIKSILEDPVKSVEIIEALRQKKRQTIQSEQELLDVLLTLEAGKEYTVPELAEALDNPKLESRKMPEEDKESCLTIVCKVLFWYMCLPAILAVVMFTLTALLGWSGRLLYVKRHPWFTSWVWCVVGTYLIPLLGAGGMITLECMKKRMDSTVRQFITIVVFICYALFGNIVFVISAIGACGLGIYSETEDPADYMVLGTMERDELGVDLELMFPDQIPAYALSEVGKPCPVTTHYYNYVDEALEREFELYAQWELTNADLEAEKNRLQETFSQEITFQGQLGEWEYWSVRMDPGPCLADSDCYDENDGYVFLFFAYQDETGMVRYVASYSSYDTIPGFCSLDWE